MQQVRRWHVYPDTKDLETHAVEAILRAAAQALQARGRFAVVLAGGETPRRIYARLARAAAGWDRWHVYFGDERCRPPGDPGRNDRMAFETWLDRVPIPRAQIRPIPAEQGAANAAHKYAETLAQADQFDLVLLGLGEDGHTASLFPGRPWNGGAGVLAVQDAPKPPPERVTLSASRLSRSRQVLFVVTGEQKREAVAAWRGGASIPAGAITPAAGVDILLDTNAWPEAFS